MQKGSVAIVGCGWLGFPLAKQLLTSGYEVFGSTTSPDKLESLRAAGIQAELLHLPLADFNGANEPLLEQGAPNNPPATSPVPSPLWRADQLVLTLPPGRGEGALKRYPAAVLSAILAFRQNQPSGRILMTSSIGVYGKEHGLALSKLTFPPLQQPTERQAALLLAESQVQTQSQRPHKILRLGGLYGGNRNPKTWFAGRPIPRPEQPANLASRDLCIQALTTLLDDPFWTGPSVYNVVDPDPISRGEAYG